MPSAKNKEANHWKLQSNIHLLVLAGVTFAAPIVFGFCVELIRYLYLPELNTSKTWLHVLALEITFAILTFIVLILVASLLIIAWLVPPRPASIVNEIDPAEIEFLLDVLQKKEDGIDIEQESIALGSLYGEENVQAFFDGDISAEQFVSRGRSWGAGILTDE